MEKNKEEQIPGGATLWARQTIESEIFYNKPDKWFKVWFYLVNRVSYKDTKKYKRGETFLQYEWVSDITGATIDQIKKCVKWLKGKGMISTRRSTRGVWVEITNYSHFQTLDNYYFDIKAPEEALGKHQRSTREALRYNKKDKKDKNINNIASTKSRRTVNTFSKDSYNNILEAYKNLKQIELQGSEYLPLQQAIKTMFLNGRTEQQIIDCMHFFNNSTLEHWQGWTLNTVKNQLPLFLAGKL